MQSTFFGKTVLVTGGAGFIGSHLCATLIDQGAQVIAVDNLLTGQVQNLAALHNNPRFTFIEADVSAEVPSYLPAGLNLDVILHFASPASPPRYQAHPVETYQVNSLATHHLLTYIKKHSPQTRFLFASTSEVYGDPLEHPQTEQYWGNVNPNGTRSCYDEAKRLGEAICGVHARDFGLDVRIVRIFNTYGPHMDPSDGRIIPQFVSQSLAHEPLTVYGDGSQTRSYCYVSDLVAGILTYAAAEGLSGETINLGNPGEYTVAETARIIYTLLHPQHTGPVPLEYKALPQDDPTRRRPDITKARKLLGWEPQVSFEEGLKSTVEYFQKVLSS